MAANEFLFASNKNLMSTSWHGRINMLEVIIFYDFEGLNLDKGLVAF